MCEHERMCLETRHSVHRLSPSPDSQRQPPEVRGATAHPRQLGRPTTNCRLLYQQPIRRHSAAARSSFRRGWNAAATWDLPPNGARLPDVALISPCERASGLGAPGKDQENGATSQTSSSRSRFVPPYLGLRRRQLLRRDSGSLHGQHLPLLAPVAALNLEPSPRGGRAGVRRGAGGAAVRPAARGRGRGVPLQPRNVGNPNAHSCAVGSWAFVDLPTRYIRSQPASQPDTGGWVYTPSVC